MNTSFVFLATTNLSISSSDGACQSNNQENSSKSRQFLIEVPGSIEISPAVLFRHLAEKFSASSTEKNDDTPFNYLIRSKASQQSLSSVISIKNSNVNHSNFGQGVSDRSIFVLLIV